MSAPPPQPPLLLLHGAGGGGWEWRIWQPLLTAAGWPGEALQLQPVAAGIEATGWGDYLQQVLAAVDRQPAPPVLIAASLGGLLAEAAAAQRVCAALIAINPLPALPEVRDLPARPPRPPRVGWHAGASLAGTRAALPAADAASALVAFRHWRDESGAVLNHAAAGLEIAAAALPRLLLASRDDRDVPPALTAAAAARLGADLLRLPGDHVDPLLGRGAAAVAELAVAWLNVVFGFTAD